MRLEDSSSVEGGEITRVHQWTPSCGGRHDRQSMTLCLPCQSVWLLVGYTGEGGERGGERGGEGRGGRREKGGERGERRKEREEEEREGRREREEERGGEERVERGERGEREG